MANLDADGGDIDTYASKEDFEEFVIETISERLGSDKMMALYQLFIAQEKTRHNTFNAEDEHDEDSQEVQDAIGKETAAAMELYVALNEALATAAKGDPE